MQIRDTKHLATQFMTRTGNVPSFALLLGSGASASSGVKTAEEMVIDWRVELYQRAGITQPFSEWVVHQDWHEASDEYGKLFERMHDLPNQRRTKVEYLVKNAEPSWGYVYLANLLDNNLFNVVLTTNFDDLLTEACYRFTNSVRPLVAAHDSTIRMLRVTSTRPKVVKLHGDFLYDNIKTIPSETGTLETNTRDKLHQFAREYGLIVIGYSGRDLSVMKSLETLLEDETTFPNGIYWCVLDLSKELPSSLRRIADDSRVYFVEVEGFDEILAEFHSIAKLDLPAGLSSTFEFARDRASRLIDLERSALVHPIIANDVTQVSDGLAKIPEVISEILPVELLATIAERNGDKETALGWWQQAYGSDNADPRVANRLMSLLLELCKDGELKELVKTAPLGPNATYWNLQVGNDEEVLRIAESELAEDPYNEVTRINKAIALKRLNFHTEKEAELDYLEEQLKDGLLRAGVSATALHAGIEALRGNRKQAFAYLEDALDRREISPDSARRFPVFEDYRSEEAFRALVKSKDVPSLLQISIGAIEDRSSEDITSVDGNAHS